MWASGSKTCDLSHRRKSQAGIGKWTTAYDPTWYRRLVGCLIYLTITRPDLTYTVHIILQFMQAPQHEHIEVARRVVRYIKGTAGQGILLKGTKDMKITAYCNSDWGSCPLSRKYLTRYFVMLGDSPVSWKTKKQTTTSRSSADVEYQSMTFTTSELIWIKSFLTSLGVFPTTPMQLYCDSEAALHIAKNTVFQERTKHIEIDCHFIREKPEVGTLKLSQIGTKHQLTDLFAKALGKMQFQYLKGKLGILDLHAPTWGGVLGYY